MASKYDNGELILVGGLTDHFKPLGQLDYINEDHHEMKGGSIQMIPSTVRVIQHGGIGDQSVEGTVFGNGSSKKKGKKMFGGYAISSFIEKTVESQKKESGLKERKGYGLYLPSFQ